MSLLRAIPNISKKVTFHFYSCQVYSTSIYVFSTIVPSVYKIIIYGLVSKQTKDAVDIDGFRLVITYNGRVVNSEESFREIFANGDICPQSGPESLEDDAYPLKLTLHKPGYRPRSCTY